MIIAQKIQTMIEKNFGNYKNYIDHTFITGEREELDIKFVDWARIATFYVKDELEPLFLAPKIKFAYQLLDESQKYIDLFKETLFSLATKEQRVKYVEIIKTLEGDSKQ